MVEEFFINQSNRLLLKTHTYRGGKFCGDFEKGQTLKKGYILDPLKMFVLVFCGAIFI